MNNRLRVTSIPALVLAGLGLSSSRSLQSMFAHSDATAEAGIDWMSLGLPMLDLTVTSDGLTGVPDSTAAGRYLVHVSGEAVTPEGPPGGAIFAQLPDGISADQAFEQARTATEEVPAFYLATTFAGGVVFTSGTSGMGIVDLMPGRWHATTPLASSPLKPIEVTGAFPADVAEPPVDVTLTLGEYLIAETSGTLTAGTNYIKLHNAGAELHFVDFMKLPDDATQAQVDSTFHGMMTGTPAPDEIPEEDVIFFAGTADISPGYSQWAAVNLEAGKYVFACWVPNAESGLPHAMMGMYSFVVVE